MSPARMDRAEAAVRAALAFHEAWNRGDAGALEGLFHPGCVLETATPAPAGERYEGTAAVLDYCRRELLKKDRSLRMVKEIYGMGNRAVLHWELVSPGSESAVLPLRGVDLIKVQMGLITEIVSYCKRDGVNPPV
jgi:ketosteroid isomerase-like protein